MAKGKVAQTGSAGTKAALAGYDYQIDVSIFAALQMLLIEKSASRVVLEPANDEDLEFDLVDVGAGRVQTSTVANGKKLVIQVKYRSGEPWSEADLARLLDHGKRRTPASVHLQDPEISYLLVTNAALKGQARGLAIDSFIEPMPSQLPKDISAALPIGAAGRVGIWAGLTPRLISHEITSILCDLLHVSRRKSGRCRKMLRDEAKLRMASDNPGIWTRKDLLFSLREYGGRLTSSPDLEAFVPPSNFQQMQALFKQRNAIVIRGPSGTGKTLAALSLLDRAVKYGGGIDVVMLGPNSDPSAARSVQNTGPRLFFIEDPWGSYVLENGAGSWTDQLPRLLRMARSDYQFIVTSRTDILREATALEALRDWSIELDDGCYQSGELAKIYDKQMDRLRPDMQPFAYENREDVLDDLVTPLELKLFFEHIEKGPFQDEYPHAFLQRVLALAHRDAVEDVVVQYLNSTTSPHAVAVVWSILKARGNFDRSQLVEVHRQLRRIGRTYVGLDRVVDRLVATNHFRQPVVTVSFAHPSVKEGFETFIKSNALSAEDAIVDLVSALTSTSGDLRHWAMGTAARIVGLARSFDVGASSCSSIFPEASHIEIDAWLETCLLSPEVDFAATLHLAAEVGTKASKLSELARWFLEGFKRGGNWLRTDWEPPFYDDAWYREIASDNRVPKVVDRFIREYFVGDNHVAYGVSFPMLLERISPETTDAFLEVTSKLITSHRTDIVTIAARGASRNIAAYETVLSAAIGQKREIDCRQSGKNEEWRQIIDTEVDTCFEDYFIAETSDIGDAATAIIAEYIRKVRESGNWSQIANHPEVGGLIHGWSDDVRVAEEEPSADELLALITIAQNAGQEIRGWEAAWSRWNTELEPLLIERIKSGEGDDGTRRMLAQCAVYASPENMADCIAIVRESSAEAVALLFDLQRAGHFTSRSAGKEDDGDFLRVLTPVEREILNALAGRFNRPASLSASAVSLLQDAAETCRAEILGLVSQVLTSADKVTAEIIRRWLIEVEDKDEAERAARAAIHTGDIDLIKATLHHRRASARRVAFEHLAAQGEAPLPEELISVASDPSGDVRLAVVKALTVFPHADYFSTLIQLVGDRWSTSDHHLSEPPVYSVAKAAAKALQAYSLIPDDVCFHLINSTHHLDDRELSVAVLSAVGSRGSRLVRQRLWDTAMQRDLQWVRVDALLALSMCSNVETEILEAAKERLSGLPAPLATACTVLLTKQLPLPEAVAQLEDLAHSTTRKALLLIGAIGMNDRDAPKARKLLALLPKGHPARKILDLNGTKLSASVLDDLGKIQYRRQVLSVLSDYIEIA